MTSRIRTALLSTAVASGLLLSNAPVYAAPLAEENATQGASVETAAGVQVVAEISAALESTASAVAPRDPSRDPSQLVSAVPVDEVAIQDEPPVAPVKGNTPAMGGDESPSVGDEGVTDTPPGINASEEATGGPSDEDSNESAGAETEQVMADPDAPAGGTSNDAETTAPASPEVATAETSQPPEESDASEVATEEVSESASVTDVDDQSEYEEFDVIFEIVDDFLETGDNKFLDELMDYLLWLFDGDEELAMEAYNEIIQGMVDEGLLVPGVEVTPAPTVEPQAPKPETKPVIKPAGNIKPVVDRKPIVEAIVKPVVKPAIQAKKRSWPRRVPMECCLWVVLGCSWSSVEC